MFPKPTPFQSKFLVELMNTLDWSSPPILETKEALRPIRQFIERYSDSKFRSIKTYVGLCENVVATIFANPSKKAFDSAAIISKQVKRLKGLNESVINKVVKEVLETPFQESVIESLVDHRGFISKLEKEFKVSVDHWEPVREGVYVYLDGENTEILSSALSDGNSYFETLVDSLGYILLKKGTIDTNWGAYGPNFAKWLFVFSPATDIKDTEDDGSGLEGEVKTLKTVDL